MKSRVQRVARACSSLLLPALVAMVGVLVLSTPAALAAPEPAPLPKRWQLEVKCSPVRLAMVKTADGQDRPYFFMTYTVTNNSPADLLFAPLFDLATDAGDVVRSGRDVSFGVTREIMARLNNPVLEDQIGIVGTLLRGEENAKEGLVIWAAPTLQLAELTVYAAGFSGETATVKTVNPETGKDEQKVLRKTLAMKYRMPGNVAVVEPGPFEPFESRWIMR